MRARTTNSRTNQTGTLEPRLAAWLDSLKPQIDPERLHADVLALPAPRNRLELPDAMEEADQMILQAFHAAGWAAARRPFTFPHLLGYLSYGSRKQVEGANIVAMKPGQQSSDALIVFGHHDTLSDTPGANDNTASVAALLEVARVLAPYRFRHTVILAATDMEETGFFGAQALVAELARERRVLEAINFETMAYTSTEPHSQSLPPNIGLLYPRQVKQIRDRQWRGDFTAVIYNRSALALATAFSAGLGYLAGVHAPLLVAAPTDHPIIGRLLRRWVPAVRNFARSDHLVFWEAGIPAIMITDTANFRYRHYHQSTDTAEKLDYQRLAAIVGATAGVIAQVAGLIDGED